jgi:hypothetical protein
MAQAKPSFLIFLQGRVAVMADYTLPFGSGSITIALPAARTIQVVDGKPVPPIKDIAAAVRQALASPIGAPPLRQVVVPGDRVAVVASDLTRSGLHHELFLPVLLDELNAAGVPDRDITLVVALGAHRRHTPDGTWPSTGRKSSAASASYKASPATGTASRSSAPPPAAWPSGSAATSSPPTRSSSPAASATIPWPGSPAAGKALSRRGRFGNHPANHRFCLSDTPGGGLNPLCGSGLLTGNPLHEDQLEIAAMLAPAFLLNVIPAPGGGIAGFVAGHWREAWEEGCRQVAAIYGVPIAEKTDLVIASAGGYPKDINFYQATKATENAWRPANRAASSSPSLNAARSPSRPTSAAGSISPRRRAGERLRERFTVPGFVALKTGLDARRIPHIIVTLPENRAF